MLKHGPPSAARSLFQALLHTIDARRRRRCTRPRRHWAFHSRPSTAMSFLRFMLSQRTMRLYLLGHLLILFGAGLMELTQSMLPMALAGSAALMLMFPLVRQLATRFASAEDEAPRR
jgi:hypothetical protein